jgi:hypothetical protein
VSSFALRAALGVLPPLLTFLRCAIAAGAGYYAAHLVPQASAWMAPLAMLAGGLAYLGALMLLRELKPADFGELRAALSKRGS